MYKSEDESPVFLRDGQHLMSGGDFANLERKDLPDKPLMILVDILDSSGKKSFLLQMTLQHEDSSRWELHFMLTTPVTSKYFLRHITVSIISSETVPFYPAWRQSPSFYFEGRETRSTLSGLFKLTFPFVSFALNAEKVLENYHYETHYTEGGIAWKTSCSELSSHGVALPFTVNESHSNSASAKISINLDFRYRGAFEDIVCRDNASSCLTINFEGILENIAQISGLCRVGLDIRSPLLQRADNIYNLMLRPE